MRQLHVEVPAGRGAQAAAIARAQGASQVAWWRAEGRDAPRDLVLLHVANEQVGALVAALDAEVGGVHVGFLPHGVLALEPPPEEAPAQVLDVAPRSPLEIYLSGLQSVGSWTSFLGFAAAAGAVVWLGLTTGAWYLLTAAMLIAPFASPALNTAVATARGDATLLGRSLGRYGASLLTTTAVAAGLSLLFGPEAPTELVVATAAIARVAAVLPVVAGFAGAVHLAQSERSSLVSAAGTGMLVAASLAPPAGLLGIATVLQEWELARSGLFLLALQVVGIQLAGALTFRAFGLRAKGPRYPAGRAWVGAVALGAAAVAFAGLLWWQLGDPPTLERSTLATQAEAAVAEEVRRSGGVELLEVDVRFPRAGIAPGRRLLAEAWVVGPDDAAPGLEARIATRLRTDFPSVEPVVHVQRVQLR